MNEKMLEILEITKEFNMDGDDPTLKEILECMQEVSFIEIAETVWHLLIAIRKINKLLTN